MVLLPLRLHDVREERRALMGRNLSSSGEEEYMLTEA
jgi:hypothetical protein